MAIDITNEELIRQNEQHLWNALYRYDNNKRPLIAASGEGAWFYDLDGTKYMDGVSGLWCLNLGHGRKDIAQVAYDQMLQMSYFPLTHSHIPAIQLSAKLSELLQGTYTTFFVNSGSEANETAFKVARQYHQQTGNPGKYKFISRYRAYHGTTLGALSATAQAHRRMKYDPMVPGFIHVPPPYPYRSLFGEGEEGDLKAAEYIDYVINWEGAETVAGVIMEPVISGGGVIVPSEKYLQRVAEICQKHHVLLILDEVVTGFGRTGEMFAFMRSKGVQPDIVTMAKGLTSGYAPLGACAVHSRIQEAFKTNGANSHFRHVSTYGGHPVSCAVALKNIEIIERENIIGHVKHLSDTILSQLHALAGLDIVGDVRGLGFLWGLEIVADKASKTPASDEVMNRIITGCKEKGLIISRNGDTVPGFNNVLIIAPPLSSTEEDLTFLVETIKAVLSQFT